MQNRHCQKHQSHWMKLILMTTTTTMMMIRVIIIIIDDDKSIIAEHNENSLIGESTVTTIVMHLIHQLHLLSTPELISYTFCP